MAILTDHCTATRPLHTGGRDLPPETWLGWMAAFTRCLVGLICTLTLLGLPVSPQTMAQDHHEEYALKAAFLYNFAKFAEWPTMSFPNDHAPFVICLAGNDPFGPNLTSLEGKLVRDRPLATKPIPGNDNLIGCHILYISPGELKQTRNILQTLQKSPVLTVCDAEGCAETGIMLNMRMVENRVALDLNLEAVQQTPLKLSAQLIKLTRIVKGQP